MSSAFVVRKSLRLPLALVVAATALAASAPPCCGQNAQGPPLGEAFVQTIPARRYYYGEFETDFASMGPPLVKTLTELMERAKEAQAGLFSPTLHFFYGAPHRDPQKKFKMETGFFIAEGVQLGEGASVRELPEFKCLSVVYVGPVTRFGEAWQKVYRSARDQGLTPTDEEREMTLYWEGPESPNNILVAQLGVK